MKFITLVTGLALSTPALTAPVDEGPFSLQGRQSGTVSCRANGGKRKFEVNVAAAQAQVTKAGLTSGKSGYPHSFLNHEKLTFAAHNCNKATAILSEYPIYWVGKKGATEWAKDVKVASQEATPLRVIFSNSNGAIEYCGVVTHETVTSQNQGSGTFVICA